METPDALPDPAPMPAKGYVTLMRVYARFLTRGGNGTKATVNLATTAAVTFKYGETDVGYLVLATPSRDTTVWVTAKAKTGFTLNFGTASPGVQSVDYAVIRP